MCWETLFGLMLVLLTPARLKVVFQRKGCQKQVVDVEADPSIVRSSQGPLSVTTSVCVDSLLPMPVGQLPASDEEAANMVLLLQRIRQELDSYAQQHAPGHHFEISIAAPAGPQHFKFLRLAELAKVVDHFNLMAYDYTGSFSNFTGHQANLYPSEENPDSNPFSTQVAVDAYIAGGVPADQIILGMPVYGRNFAGTDGPGKPFSGVGEGSWEVGVCDYKGLLPNAGAAQSDKKIGAAWTYDEASKSFVSFDTPEMVRQKVAYAQDMGLGGSMFWEISADKDGADSLITASLNAMDGLGSTENCLDYPASIYDNIKDG